MKNKLIEICKKAKKASNQIIDNKIKNKVLLKFAHLVNKNKFFFYLLIDASNKILFINCAKDIFLYLAISGTNDKDVIPG